MRSLRDLFEEMEIAKKLNKEFVIKISYLEIYNDQVFDLLREDCS